MQCNPRYKPTKQLQGHKSSRQLRRYISNYKQPKCLLCGNLETSEKHRNVCLRFTFIFNISYLQQ